MIKKCKNCNKDFESHSILKVYCCHFCRKDYWNKSKNEKKV